MTDLCTLFVYPPRHRSIHAYMFCQVALFASGMMTFSPLRVFVPLSYAAGTIMHSMCSPSQCLLSVLSGAERKFVEPAVAVRNAAARTVFDFSPLPLCFLFFGLSRETWALWRSKGGPRMPPGNRQVAGERRRLRDLARKVGLYRFLLQVFFCLWSLCFIAALNHTSLAGVLGVCAYVRTASSPLTASVRAAVGSGNRRLKPLFFCEV